jgi:uncharacterized LabA/DUF88 family protein
VSKNVAVFVDVANIFYAAKAAGVDIDYVTLLKSAIAGRDFVRAYAYTGLDPENENQRNFHAFLARHGYKVVSKDIRKYGDGKVKANLDIELVVDMLKTARNLDGAIVVSGDGDFAPAIRAVQEMGVRVEVISFRGNTSSDLMDVADSFTDIVNLAKVEKGSSRSGRRVAGDDEDLSMTEVPDKQTEGTGRGRGRGRGRERGTPEAEPVAAIAASGARRRSSSAAAAAVPGTGAAGLLVLPGERLARAGSAGSTDEPEGLEEGEVAPEPVEATNPIAAVGSDVRPDLFEGEAGRRRRRRGGRGRGRGRGRTDEGFEKRPVREEPPVRDERPLREERPPRAPRLDEEPLAATPRGPRTTPFGSVWDSQLGVERTPSPALSALPTDEEFDDEPEIPEYLLAERRNRAQGGRPGQGGRGGRGGARSAYSAAVDRERYGRGGGGGLNRYPDVSRASRPPQGGGRSQPYREERQSFARPQRPPRNSAEPWSEVPPEVEEMLRAQLAAKGGQPARPDREPVRTEGAAGAGSAAGAQELATETGRPARGGRRRPASTVETAGDLGQALVSTPEPIAEAPATRRRTARAKPATGEEGSAASGRRSRTRAAVADSAQSAAPTDSDTATAPKRRATRTSGARMVGPTADAPASSEGERTPRKRTTRTKTESA